MLFQLIYIYIFLANCQAGSKIVGDSCELCPVGEYQPDPYQEDCMTCDDDRTTLSTGSTSEDDCLCECYSYSSIEKLYVTLLA